MRCELNCSVGNILLEGGARANMQPANQSRLPERILNIIAIPHLQFWVF